MNTSKKSVIITGVTGQDGAYLTQLLLEKGYKVYGTYRRTSSVNFWRLEELGVVSHENLELVEHDLTDLGASIRLLQKAEPTEVYNLAAQSFVGVSFDQPVTTAEITGIGAVNLWKRSVSLTRRFASIKPPLRKCSVKFSKFRRPRTPIFIRVAHTEWLSFMRTG